MSTSVDDETILAVLRDADAPELTTSAVAEELPVTRGTTRTRLQRLVDEGQVRRRREGNSVVWWLPDREAEAEAAREAAAADESDDADGADTEDAATEAAATEDEGDADTDEADDDPAVEAPEDDTSIDVQVVQGDDDGVTVTVRADDEEYTASTDESSALRVAAVAAVAAVGILLLRRLLKRD